MSSPGLPVTAVARRLGVAPATLRTWDRRYGLGPSGHQAGTHRRYTVDDLARLLEMRRLTLEGVTPGEAARSALSGVAPVQSSDNGSAASGGPPEPQTQLISRPGRSLADEVRGLYRAARALDGPAVGQAVRDHLELSGLQATWERLLVPVLVAAGRRWELTGRGVEVEHLLSEAILGAFRSRSRQLPEPTSGQPVLLACAETELHALPLHAVAAGLRERGVATRFLGSQVPRDALSSAVRRSGPLAVFVYAHLLLADGLEQLRAMPSVRPSPLIVVGGPGWPQDLPAGVRRVNGLGEAVEALAAPARQGG
jgi:MerR family transcriptional regulator, light-induced transcriptional regulator